MKTFCGKMPGAPGARRAGGGCGNPWWVRLERGHGVEKQHLSFLGSDFASGLGEEALYYLSGVYLGWGKRRQHRLAVMGQRDHL